MVVNGKRPDTIFPVIALVFQLMAVLSGMRALVIGYLGGYLLIEGIVRKKPVLSFAGLIVAALCVSMFFKTDSSLGRCLIYKVSLLMATKALPFGIGIGAFSVQYNHFQAAYFVQGQYTLKELLLADNTYFAFNDYWQFLLECGLLGLLYLLLVSIAVSKIVITLRKTYTHHVIFRFVSWQLLSFAIAASFNHIFDRWWCQAILWSSLSIFAYLTAQRLRILWYASIVMLSVATGLMTHPSLLQFSARKQFKTANELTKAGFDHEASLIYTNIYPTLKNDHVFLLEVAKAMRYRDQYPAALQVLRRAENIFSSNDLFLTLAECLDHMQRKTEAEYYYLLSINSVPNRFYNRLCLIRFYDKEKMYDKKNALIHYSLQLPIKIPSEKVLAVRSEIKSLSDE